MYLTREEQEAKNLKIVNEMVAANGNLKPNPEANQILKNVHGVENAVIVSSYPYGSMRCIIRYYLEHKPKMGTRFVSQTVNPKKAFVSWNAPKPSTYTPHIVVLYTDENAHVQRADLSDMIFFGKESATALTQINDFEAKYGEAFTDSDRSALAFLKAYAIRKGCV